MSVDVEKRINQLQDLNSFISNAEVTLGNIVKKLDWSLNDREPALEMVHCPNNIEHRVPKEHLQKHIESCSWRSEGYHKDDIPLPDAMDAVHSIKIDGILAKSIIQDAVSNTPSMKTGVLELDCNESPMTMLKISFFIYSDLRFVDRPTPQTADRIVSDFTTDERRALYDYVISKSEAETVKLEDLNFLSRTETRDDEQPKSRLEMLAAERDAKRRRISHRTKKISTNRKSHLEVMREVIQNQMELYQLWLNKDAVQEEDTLSKTEDDTIVREESHLHQDSRFERDHENAKRPHLSSETQRRPSESSFVESRESSRSYKHEGYSERKSGDRSKDRDSHRRYDCYSSYDKREHRDDCSEGRSRDHQSRSKDRHKDTREDRDRERRHRRESTNGREYDGNYGHREEKKAKERRERSSRDSRRSDEYMDYHTEQTDRSNSSQTRQIVNPYYGMPAALERGVQVEKTGYDPSLVIKTEIIDESNNPMWNEELSVEEPKVERMANSTAIKLEDRVNEWSEDSQKSNSSSTKVSKKRKKKKEKKSKHKRKKHSKHGKHSKHSVSSDTEAFSC